MPEVEYQRFHSGPVNSIRNEIQHRDILIEQALMSDQNMVEEALVKIPSNAMLNSIGSFNLT